MVVIGVRELDTAPTVSVCSTTSARTRAEWGVMDKDDDATWDWPDVEWILGGKSGAECACSHADLDSASTGSLASAAALSNQFLRRSSVIEGHYFRGGMSCDGLRL